MTISPHKPMSSPQFPTTRIAGWLLFAAILSSIVHGIGVALDGTIPALLFWAAGLMLFVQISGMQRIQTLLMFLIGAAGLLYAWLNGAAPQLEKAIATNQALLAMLGGVTFLRLVTLPEVDRGEADPQGRAALWRTLLGVHLFGSVINISAIIILGDRMSRRTALSGLQACVLTRGFALAAHWSPFFAAMGIALSNAPGAQLLTLSTYGLPLALLLLLLSGWQLGRQPDSVRFVGYPMHFGALWIPGLLALLVMTMHQLFAAIPILTLISAMSITLTLLVLNWRRRSDALRRFVGQIEQGLPKMSGELTLFLAAGVLAAGIGSAVQSTGWALDLPHFGATQASLLLVLMTLVSAAGVHPVISIATAHGILLPLAPDPNLMGITYLMAWATGVISSPFSGIHLAIHGRYGVDTLTLIRWNLGYVVVCLLIESGVLHLYQMLHGS